jgi:hypothetical protein
MRPEQPAIDRHRPIPTANRASWRGRRIAMWAPWSKPACGIVQYAEQLAGAFNRTGVSSIKIDPLHVTSAGVEELLRREGVDGLCIQYAPFFFSTASLQRRLSRALTVARSAGIPAIAIVHEERGAHDLSDASKANRLAATIPGIISHRPLLEIDTTRAEVLPFPVPPFAPPSRSREQAKQRFGFGRADLLVSTSGFFAPRKNIPAIVEELAGVLRRDGRLVLQLLANARYQRDQWERDATLALVRRNRLEDRVVIVDRFLPLNELHERLWMSDVGFLWAAPDHNSGSASQADMIAARLPMVVNESAHFDRLTGVVATANRTSVFVKTITDVVNDPERRRRMRRSLGRLCEARSFDSLVDAFIRRLAGR